MDFQYAIYASEDGIDFDYMGGVHSKVDALDMAEHNTQGYRYVEIINNDTNEVIWTNHWNLPIGETSDV